MKNHPRFLAIGACLIGFGCLFSPPSRAQHPGAGVEQRADFYEPDGNVSPKKNVFRSAFKGSPERTPSEAPMLSANGDEGVTIWGNVLYARSWGEYEQYFGFKAYNYKPSGLTIEQVCHDEYLFANGSGAFYNGKFHMISRNWTMLYCEYDMNTWEQLSQELHATKFAKLVATDCDYDPMTGLTYGCFWNDETKEYEFASVDYETLTHNTIAPMEIFSAIAINQ